jgi:mannosylglycoprotein endo-beta-mannosidase
LVSAQPISATKTLQLRSRKENKVLTKIQVQTLRRLVFAVLMTTRSAMAAPETGTVISGWSLQDAAKVTAAPEVVSSDKFKPQGWYPATVPGTVLTTLVDNKVYPEPLYGENMRNIPESLNKTSYWYRSTFLVPAANNGKLTWLHFAGINYSADVWVNRHKVGSIRGAFIRGDFDVSAYVKPGTIATLAVLVAPQPHPGVPIEHTVANGVGKNGGITAVDGPTFLSTIGWDWLPGIRDRDTGIWLPVTVDATGPVVVKDPIVRSELATGYESANLTVAATLQNETDKPIAGTLFGTISVQGDSGAPITLTKDVTMDPRSSVAVSLNTTSTPTLHITSPKLWWPNGYGAQNLYKLTLQFRTGKKSELSSQQETTFGIRKLEYAVEDSENLTLSVNGVRVMARGGDWGLDDGMKRVPYKRLDAQFHMHALANLNIIRNWVGQSTNLDFYDLADKYGILLWDEFFQPNPDDGPNPADTATYIANVTDKVVRFRNHPSIAVWCARNEGYPPKELDDKFKVLMAELDPSRLYQSNSADGRGVSSGGPYYWRSPRYFYALHESFKTETGSVSVPTIESIQGMMPKKDWETINDDWAQHDMARGAQMGDKYPFEIARRYGHIRNLADFVRKAQLANYEAYRAMYESRNAEMFKTTTGIITWMSHPAQPSFVWQLYHYDLEPNASLYGTKKAAEQVHVQLNESNGDIQVVNNRGVALTNSAVRETIYLMNGMIFSQRTFPVAQVPASTTVKVAQTKVDVRQELYFVKLDLAGGDGKLLSTNLYWQNETQDDFTGLEKLPTAQLTLTATSRMEGVKTLIDVSVKNSADVVALMAHLQLHKGAVGPRVLPVFYSDNYMSLAPRESRTLTIEAATSDLAGETPSILVDGFNVDVKPVDGAVVVRLNENAQPLHWPASGIVADKE